MATSAVKIDPNPDYPGPVLRMTRTLNATPERVFHAFTDTELLARWWGPEGCTASDPKVDLRVGGTYHLNMQQASGDLIHLSGTYQVVEPPHRLVFTWKWGGENPDGETLVTLDFHNRDGSTELVLTHEGFSSDERRDRHNQGWSSSIDCLEQAL